MDRAKTSLAVDVALSGVLYAAAATAALIIFIALLHLPPFQAISILFYRGLAALAATGLILLFGLSIVLRQMPPTLSLTFRDAIGATIVAVSLMLAAFVVGPVTTDRSISMFLLSRLEATDNGLTIAQARDAFSRIYVGQWDQIGRRFAEQEASGNLHREGETWRLTPQGHTVAASARLISNLFGGDSRFVSGSPAAGAP